MVRPSTRASVARTRTRLAGFTLIEMLTVIAVIAILVAILVPTVSGAMKSAKRAKTKAQFAQWALAIEGFRQEYGYYPNFGLTNGLITDTTPASTTAFVETLSGRQLDGDPLIASDPGHVAGNKKHLSFCSFGTGELTASSDAVHKFLLRDPFGCTQIVVLTDRNLDGLIHATSNTTDSYSEAPSVKGFSPNFPTTGIRAGVIFYSAGAGESESDIIKSWE